MDEDTNTNDQNHDLEIGIFDKMDALLLDISTLKAAQPEKERRWAIAYTQAEQLYAWLGFTLGSMEEDA